MAGSKEIRNKIKSVQSTRKITKAMEMVAASKMKKSQDRMRASRPYVGRMVAIARHLARATPEYRHEMLMKRPQVRNVGLIVVTTDKAACSPPALERMLPEAEHLTGKLVQQGIERDHGHLKSLVRSMRWFKTDRPTAWPAPATRRHVW